MPLGAEAGLDPGHIVLDGDPASLLKKGGGAPAQPPSQFLADACCGQTAGWVKMPLGTEVGLGPGHIVFDGDWGPSSPQRGKAATPLFGKYLLTK